MFTKLNNLLPIAKVDATGDITVAYRKNSAIDETTFNTDLTSAGIDDSGYRIRGIKSKCNNIAQSHKFTLSVSDYTNKPTVLITSFIIEHWTPRDWSIDYADWKRLITYQVEGETGYGVNAGRQWYGLAMNTSGDRLMINNTDVFIFDNGDEMGVFAEERWE